MYFLRGIIKMLKGRKERRRKMKKQKHDIDEYVGAILVLENFLDGAVADYENGDV